MIFISPINPEEAKTRSIEPGSIMNFEDYILSSGSFANGFAAYEPYSDKFVSFVMMKDDITLQFMDSGNFKRLEARKNDVIMFTEGKGGSTSAFTIFDPKRNFDLQFASVVNAGPIQDLDVSGYGMTWANRRKAEYLQRTTAGEDIPVSNKAEFGFCKSKEMRTRNFKHGRTGVMDRDVYIDLDYHIGHFGGCFFKEGDIFDIDLDHPNSVYNNGFIMDEKPELYNPDLREYDEYIAKRQAEYSALDDKPIPNAKTKQFQEAREVPEFGEQEVCSECGLNLST